MKFKKNDGFYSCNIQSGPIAFYFALEFAENETIPDFQIRRHGNYSQKKVEPVLVLENVEKAVREKEEEYGRRFYIKTIRFYDDEDIGWSWATKVDYSGYYLFTKLIIDRIMSFPDDYNGDGMGG